MTTTNTANTANPNETARRACFWIAETIGPLVVIVDGGRDIDKREEYVYCSLNRNEVCPTPNSCSGGCKKA
jgi:hypothetical protein